MSGNCNEFFYSEVQQVCEASDVISPEIFTYSLYYIPSIVCDTSFNFVSDTSLLLQL